MQSFPSLTQSIHARPGHENPLVIVVGIVPTARDINILDGLAKVLLVRASDNGIMSMAKDAAPFSMKMLGGFLCQFRMKGG